MGSPRNPQGHPCGELLQMERKRRCEDVSVLDTLILIASMTRRSSFDQEAFNSCPKNGRDKRRKGSCIFKLSQGISSSLCIVVLQICPMARSPFQSAFLRSLSVMHHHRSFCKRCFWQHPAANWHQI